MSDALDLVLLTKSQKLEIDEEYKSYTRVMPTMDQAHASVGMSVYQIRQLFYKLCSLKDQMSLTSGQFEKMYSYPIMKQSGIQRANLQLLFQKVSGNEKSIDLIRFVEVMQALHSILKDKNADVGETLMEFIDICLE